MSMPTLVPVRCEICKLHLGEREVDEVRGECLEVPCRTCFPKMSGGIPVPQELETEWAILDQSLLKSGVISHPEGQPLLLDVNMEYNGPSDTWIFQVPRKLSSKAFDQAKAKVLKHYEGIVADFRQVGLDEQNGRVVEQLEKAILSLKANRIRQVVNQGLLKGSASF
jgi:hypothetical protein